MLEFVVTRPLEEDQQVRIKYYGTSESEVATDIICDHSINGDALYDLIVLLTNIYSNNMDQYYEQAKR